MRNLKKILLSGLFLFFGVSPLFSLSITKLTYVIEPLSINQAKQLIDGITVDLFIALKDVHNEDLLLHVPEKFLAHDLYKHISHIELVNGNGWLQEHVKPAVLKLCAPKDGVVHIRYQIHSAVKDAKKIASQICLGRPVITNEYMYLLGHSFIMFPCQAFAYKGDLHYIDLIGTFNIELIWNNMPQNWKLANSHAVGQARQSLNVTLEQFKESVYLAGDLRVHNVLCGQKPLFFVMRGSLPFTDEQLISTCSRLILAQRDFWQDHAFDYFLIAMVPMESRGLPDRPFSGLALHNSFSLVLDQGHSDLKEIAFLMSHESFHIWNGNKIKVVDTMRWFMEGFTDYYAYLFCLRTEIFTLQDYVDSINKTLRDLYFIYENRETEEFRPLIPYIKGRLCAFDLDAKIKKRTNFQCCLDDFMKDVWVQVSQKKETFAEKKFKQVMRKYVPFEIANYIKTHIYGDQIFDLDSRGCGPFYKKGYRSFAKNDGSILQVPQYILKT